jgi:peptide-methionine (S)-S-oxide reductase
MRRRPILGLAFALLCALAAPGGSQTRSDTAVFAAGCFWCVEEVFDNVPGVSATTSGYTAGRTPNPTYEQVSTGGTGHTEAVQVTYDPAKVTYDQLLEVFWRNVDAVDGGGQFCDRGSQYRSGIYVRSDDERKLAEASKARIAAKLGKPVATEIVAAGTFYAAEDYHQDYYKKNPVRYKFYKWNCGRAQRLEELWRKHSGQ